MLLCTILMLNTHAQISNDSIQVSVKDSERIVADATYNVPIDKVWELLRKPENFPKLHKRVLSAEFMGILKGSERYFVKVQTPGWLPDMWNIISTTFDEAAHKVTWEKLEGNLMNHHGNVTLKTQGATTLLHLEMNVQALGILPTRAVNWAVTSNMKRFLKTFGEELKTQVPETGRKG